MRSTPILFALCMLTVFAFFGCTKNTFEEQLLAPETKAGMQVGTANEQGELIENRFVSPSKDMIAPTLKNRSNPNQIITGHYTSASGSQVELRAILNESGVHGEVEFQSSTYGLMQTKTLCVSTNQNGEGIIALHIISVENPISLFQPNNIMYMKVKDNGEGAKSKPDQSSQYVWVFYDWFNYYATPQALVEDYPCATYPNSFGSMLNVAKGQIQVR